MHNALCAPIVASVSPSCTRTDDHRASSSSSNRQAIVLAAAVIAAVISQAFICHHPIIYTNLLTSCKLTAYLADIDEQAEDMFFRLVDQLAEKEGLTEKLKADNQMLWVTRMNNIRNQATEIVNDEIVYNI